VEPFISLPPRDEPVSGHPGANKRIQEQGTVAWFTLNLDHSTVPTEQSAPQTQIINSTSEAVQPLLQ